MFDTAPLGAEVRVLGQRLELAQVLQVAHPLVADALRDAMGEPRIGQHHPAPRRHAIGLVGELLQRDSRGFDSTIQRRGVTPLVLLRTSPATVREVAEHVTLEQLRMQRGHAVDGMAADAGEMRHAHVALAGFVDQ